MSTHGGRKLRQRSAKGHANRIQNPVMKPVLRLHLHKKNRNTVLTSLLLIALILFSTV